jgi:hypothetical protein
MVIIFNWNTLEENIIDDSADWITRKPSDSGENIKQQIGQAFSDIMEIYKFDTIEKIENYFISINAKPIFEKLLPLFTDYLNNRRNQYAVLEDIHIYLELCCEKDKSKYCTFDVFSNLLHSKKMIAPNLFYDYIISYRDDIKDEMQGTLEERFLMIDEKTLGKTRISRCKCNNILDLCVASIYHILHEEYLIKKCEVCNKFFVPFKRSDAHYCDRISPDDKKRTCKEFGSIRKYQEHLKNDDIAVLIRKVYMKKQMASKRNSGSKYTEDFEKFKTELKNWRDAIAKNRIANKGFIEWLNSVHNKM